MRTWLDWTHTYLHPLLSRSNAVSSVWLATVNADIELAMVPVGVAIDPHSRAFMFEY